MAHKKKHQASKGRPAWASAAAHADERAANAGQRASAAAHGQKAAAGGKGARSSGKDARPAHNGARPAQSGGTSARSAGKNGKPTPAPALHKNGKSAPASAPRKGAFTCPIDEVCGGCQWLAVPYAEQLSRKQREVEALFDGLFDSRTRVCDIAGMADPRYYRAKVVSPYVGVWDRNARRRRVLCGMYERGTHRVIDSGECLIENREAKRIILTIRDLMGRFRIAPYDEDADTGFLRHAQVRVAHATGEIMVTLVTREEAFPGSKAFVRALREKHPGITTVVQNVNTRQTNVILGERERTLFGPGFILDELCGLSFRISSKSFYQVNVEQTEVLYTRAVQMAHLAGTETLLDAYCGTGTIGLVAARGVGGMPGAARVIGVEERASAVADARANARHNGVEAEFVVADAGAFMREAAASGERIDVLMMDPPRAGSTPEFLKAACELAPGRIVYISCNPTTQARDAAFLIERGWRIEELQPVDMFPHTSHTENIIALVRA